MNRFRFKNCHPVRGLLVLLGVGLLVPGCVTTHLDEFEGRSTTPPSKTPNVSSTAGMTPPSVMVGKAATRSGSGTLITGFFEGGINLQGLPATYLSDQQVSHYGPGSNVFVARLGSDGSWEWVATAGGPGRDAGVEVDGFADGSSVVTGFFQQSISFSPTVDGTDLTLKGAEGWSMFVARLNEDGKWLAAALAVAEGSADGKDVVALDDGSVLVIGGFVGDTVFYGASTIRVKGGPQPSGFVALWDRDGTWRWVAELEAESVRLFAATLTRDGLVAIGGGARNEVVLKPESVMEGNGTTPSTFEQGDEVAFVAWIDLEGNWRKMMYASSTGPAAIHTIQPTLEGVVVAGGFEGSITFNGSSPTVSAVVLRSITPAVFVSSWSFKHGWKWASSVASPSGRADGFDLASVEDRFVVAGSFYGTLTFTDTPNLAAVSAIDNEDAFVASINSQGVWRSVDVVGGPGQNVIFALADLPNGSLRAVGVNDRRLVTAETGQNLGPVTEVLLADVDLAGRLR